MTLTREQIEAMRSFNLRDIEMLCTLALEGLELRAENERLQREWDEAGAKAIDEAVAAGEKAVGSNLSIDWINARRAILALKEKP